MPTPRKLPPDSELRRLYRQGKTTVEIAAEYGSSPSAVSQHWSRLGLDPRRARHALLLPWQVSNEHTHAIIPTYLRLLSRLSKGEVVKDRRASSAFRWAMKNEGVHAVHYLPAEGWRLLPINDADEAVHINTVHGPVTIHLGSLPVED